MNTFVNYFNERGPDLGKALLEHIQISLVALFFAVIISVPLGIYLTRHKRIAEPIIGITAIMQTIPSLALLGLLIPLVGIGKGNAIIALTLYALLPILRNTYTGITEVDPSLCEASRALGMTTRQQLTKVELPLALPIIMAGIRTAMVLIIGTATLAALIGAGGLGDLILLGIDRNDNYLIVFGAVPAALLALLFDFLLRLIEKSTKNRSPKRALISVIVAALVLGTPFAFSQAAKSDLVFAGKTGSEADILINMYKLLIEDETDLKVDLKPGFGATTFVYSALKSKEIDLYPEYSGTVITNLIKEKPTSHDRKEVFEQARKGLDKKEDLALLQPMNFNNTYALAVPEQFAKENNLKTISDLQRVRSQLKPGFTLEFSDREDGYKGIQKTYGLQFSNLKTMQAKLRYRAIHKGDINLVDAYATDGEMKQFNLKILEDDKSMFPPYQCAPLLRKETLEKYPELKKILNKLGGKISDAEMQEMNYAVNAKGESPKKVAEDFLKQKGLLK